MSGANSMVWIAPRAQTVADLPFVMHDEGPITTDAARIPSLNHRWWYDGAWHDEPPQPAPPQPATAEQAERIIRLLTDIRDQLARAFGPGR